MQTTQTTANFDILLAALGLAGASSWQEITLTQIAKEAGVALSDLYPRTDKPALCAQLDVWADVSMSAESFDPEDTPRERLFDAIMRRFETFETERAGVLSLMRWRDGSPRLRAGLIRTRAASANWALASAGLDTQSALDLQATRLGLAWVIGQTERAWRADDGGDFARTMATLDAELIGAEDRLAVLKRFNPAKRRNTSASAADRASEANEPIAAGSDAPASPQAENDRD